MFPVPHGEVDVRRRSLDQRRQRRGELLLALERAHLLRHRVDLVEILLLHEARAPLVLEDHQVFRAVELQPFLQVRRFRHVVGRVDLRQRKILPAHAHVLVQQRLDLLLVLRIDLGREQHRRVHRRIQSVQHILRLRRQRVELRRRKIAMHVILEAQVIDDDQDHREQQQRDPAVKAGGAPARP